MWMRRAGRMRTLRLVHAVMRLATRRDVDFGGASMHSLHQPDATRQLRPSTAGDVDAFFT